jgi:hypothetical protein
MPINYIIIESIRRFGEFYGDDLLVECPVGSGTQMNLIQVADELTLRLIKLFDKDEKGKRPTNGEESPFYERPGNEHLILFYEYFHGDNGSGLGASHQTGWTALVAKLVYILGDKQRGKTVSEKHEEEKAENDTADTIKDNATV